MDSVQIEKAVKALGDKPTLKNFIEQFGVFAQGPEGILKTKNLFMGLCLSGSLTKQNISENCASSKVIEDYRGEYSRKYKRKLKEYNFGKPLLHESKIPENWSWYRVGHLCDIQTGATPSKQRPEFFGRDIRWLVSGDINQGEIFDCEGRITEEGLRSSNCKILPENIVMMALNGQGKTRATVALLRIEAACNQSLVGIIPFSEALILPEFLFIALKYRYYEIRDITGQKQRRGLNMGLVSELSIPLPPLEEQKRIVAKVNELMALCDQLQAQQQQQANTLLKANTAAIHALLSVDTTPAKIPTQEHGNQEASKQKPQNKKPLDSRLRGNNKDGLNQAWQRIADNFHTLYGSTLPMPPGEGRQKKYCVGMENLNQLRLSILELAMLGRLTKQDYSNSSAGLISKLISEGEKLREEKGIRKVKKIYLPENFIPPQTIPENWEWVSLDTICYQVTDGAHHTPVYTETGVPFISVKDLTNGSISFERTRFVSNKTHKELSTRCNPEYGDMLLTKVGTTGVARFVDIDRPFSLFVSVALLKYYQPSLDSSFFEYLLNSPLVKKQSDEGTQGVGNKNLVLKTIRAFYLPIPPMEEQKRIVAKVDKLMALCDQLEQQLTTAYGDAEKLLNATMLSLVA